MLTELTSPQCSFRCLKLKKNHIPSDNSFGFDCTYTLIRWIASAFKQPKPFFFSDRETVLLCQMCNAIAQGFMQPWIPALPPPTAPTTPIKEKSEMPEKTKGRQSGKGAKGVGGPSKGSLHTATVDPEATPDLKQALEVRVTTV